jgi:Tfp pilus assembly protein PilX
MSQRNGERGMATVLVLTVLAILTIFAVVNGRTIAQLGRELKRTEQRQVHGQSPGH